MSENKNYVFSNGKIQDKSEVSIEITDAGFNFGASIYELGRIMNKTFYQLQEHLERFITGCEKIGIPCGYDIQQLTDICMKLKEKNLINHGFVYIQCSFGSYNGLRNHIFPAEIKPTLVMFTQHLGLRKDSDYEIGVPLQSALDQRHSLCNIKTTALLASILPLNKAHSEGFDEVVFYTENKIVTELASANIFCIKDNIVYTAPLSNKVLPGITRATVIEIARNNNIELKEEEFDFEFLLKSDEVFCTSTTRFVLPVSRIDDHEFKVGSVSKRLANLMFDEVEKLCSLTLKRVT